MTALLVRDLARRVADELSALGYEPRLHEPPAEGGAFEISLPGAGFDLDDFRTMARISEDFGLGLKLDETGRITLHSV